MQMDYFRNQSDALTKYAATQCNTAQWSIATYARSIEDDELNGNIANSSPLCLMQSRLRPVNHFRPGEELFAIVNNTQNANCARD